MNASKSNVVIPSLEQVENYLQQYQGISMDDISKLLENKKNIDHLNEYRGALSLWAEYTEDTKNKIIVTLDGRDTAGKGSNIKRVTEYLDEKRYVKKAFGIPTAEEKKKWNWFDRYKNFFPDEGEIMFFDRSWYNRAGVEAAMGFCTQEEYDWFMEHVNQFEKDQIVDMGYHLVKVYLSITKSTQKKRLKNRDTEMKRWKSSKIDAQAQEKWNYYSLAKAKILECTDSEHAPWLIVDSNEKHLSAIEIIKAIVNTSSEVSHLVSDTLSLDLSPDSNITRSATEELERMKQDEGYDKIKSDFHFAEAV